jgi:hypothetical protein
MRQDSQLARALKETKWHRPVILVMIPWDLEVTLRTSTEHKEWVEISFYCTKAVGAEVSTGEIVLVISQCLCLAKTLIEPCRERNQ